MAGARRTLLVEWMPRPLGHRVCCALRNLGDRSISSGPWHSWVRVAVLRLSMADKGAVCPGILARQPLRVGEAVASIVQCIRGVTRCSGSSVLNLEDFECRSSCPSIEPQKCDRRSGRGAAVRYYLRLTRRADGVRVNVSFAINSHARAHAMQRMAVLHMPCGSRARYCPLVMVLV